MDPATLMFVIGLGALLLLSVAANAAEKHSVRQLTTDERDLGRRVLEAAGLSTTKLDGEGCWQGFKPVDPRAVRVRIETAAGTDVNGRLVATAELGAGGPGLEVEFRESAGARYSSVRVRIGETTLMGSVSQWVTPFFPELAAALDDLMQPSCWAERVRRDEDGRVEIGFGFRNPSVWVLEPELVAWTRSLDALFEAATWREQSVAGTLISSWRRFPHAERNQALQCLFTELWEDAQTQNLVAEFLASGDPRRVAAVYKTRPAEVEQRFDGAARERMLKALSRTSSTTALVPLAPMLTPRDLHRANCTHAAWSVLTRAWIEEGRSDLEEAISISLAESPKADALLTIRALAASPTDDGYRALASLQHGRIPVFASSPILARTTLATLTLFATRYSTVEKELAAGLEGLVVALFDEARRHKTGWESEVQQAIAIMQRIGAHATLKALQEYASTTPAFSDDRARAQRAIEVVKQRIAELPNAGSLTLPTGGDGELSLSDE